MFGLLGLFIQLKRGGLAVRRLFFALGRGLAWLVQIPAGAVRRLANIGRGLGIQSRRAGLRVRRLFNMRTAWTFATAAGTLGIILMMVLQLMYSFQWLGAKESPEHAAVHDESPKTRIDPGLPQARQQDAEPALIAQIDPFAPAQPDHSFDPLPVEPRRFEPAPNPEPNRSIPKPAEPVPFVDPLDNLPSHEPDPPAERGADPFSPVPQINPDNSAPSEFPPFDPRPAEPDPLENPPPVKPPMQTPPGREPEPFIDPLDNLPPLSPESSAMPMEPQPTPALEPDPFIDPLENLSPPELPRPDSGATPDPQPAAPEQIPEPLPMDEPPAPRVETPPGIPPQKEPEPFVDPLDNLPPFGPAEPPPMEPGPAEPEPMLHPFPEQPAASPTTPPFIPPRNEPEPFVDPLDNLPPFGPRPVESEPVSPPMEPGPAEPEPMLHPLPEQPAASPTTPPVIPPRNEPEPFVDPLDNLPPFGPLPVESDPVRPPMEEPAAPPMIPGTPVELGVGVLRLPKDDEERFLLESGTVRENLSREVRLDAWDRFVEQRREPLPVRSYWDRLSREEKQRLEENLGGPPTRTEYDPGPEPARTDLNLGVQKHLPPKSTVHEPLKYDIIVENRGQEMIDMVDVDEAVPPTHRLTDVSPAAYFESQLLRWRLKELRPGEQRRLEVEVVPTESGAIETITSVRPMARVSFLTQVEKANTAESQTQVYRSQFRLRRSGYRTMAMSETVLFTNHVQNLSGAMQHDLEIIEQVPAGFRVVEVENEGIYDRVSNTITWQIASLPAGETAKLGVRLEARSTGEVVSRVKGSSREGQAVPIRARVQVHPFRAERAIGRAPQAEARGRCSCRPNCCCPACRCR